MSGFLYILIGNLRKILNDKICPLTKPHISAGLKQVVSKALKALD